VICIILDVYNILPQNFERKELMKEIIENGRIRFWLKSKGKGHDSKKFVVNRFILLDDLFFEGLGLWQGEGSKSKGLYFGNNCPALINHFLNFVEEKLGIRRDEFRVTVNSPNLNRKEELIKERWSELLRIPVKNFTNVCYDTRIRKEYVQVYINGIALLCLIKTLHERLSKTISRIITYAASYIRGIIASEGSIHLKKSGVLSHVAISTKNLEDIKFYKICLTTLGIKSTKYQEKRCAFPIYGKRNFIKMLDLDLVSLHPEKKVKFENGLMKISREVCSRKEMFKRILVALSEGNKTYDELASITKKSRSVIQSHYIPLLEDLDLVRRVGKKKQAWLFGITKKGKEWLKDQTLL